MNVQSIMSVLLTKLSVFHFTHGLHLAAYVFVWNYLRFFLHEMLNHPSCFDVEKENPKHLYEKNIFLELSFSTGEFV